MAPRGPGRPCTKTILKLKGVLGPRRARLGCGLPANGSGHVTWGHGQEARGLNEPCVAPEAFHRENCSHVGCFAVTQGSFEPCAPNRRWPQAMGPAPRAGRARPRCGFHRLGRFYKRTICAMKGPSAPRDGRFGRAPPSVAPGHRLGDTDLARPSAVGGPNWTSCEGPSGATIDTNESVFSFL